jgi:hypothetical protein
MLRGQMKVYLDMRCVASLSSLTWVVHVLGGTECLMFDRTDIVRNVLFLGRVVSVVASANKLGR